MFKHDLPEGFVDCLVVVFVWLCNFLDGNCAKCGKSDLILSNSARNAEIKSKVDILIEQKRQRHLRRQRYHRFVGEKKLRLEDKKAGTDYEKWDQWEPDSEPDSEDIPIPDGPEFKAMERDFEVHVI